MADDLAERPTGQELEFSLADLEATEAFGAALAELVRRGPPRRPTPDHHPPPRCPPLSLSLPTAHRGGRHPRPSAGTWSF